MARELEALLDAWQASLADLPAEVREVAGVLLGHARMFAALAAPPDGAPAPVTPLADQLDLWRRFAARAAAPEEEGAAPSEAWRAYEAARADYAASLARLGAEIAADVTVQTRGAHAPASLRELFDRAVEVGEARHRALLASPEQARRLGELINTLLAAKRDVDGSDG